MEAKRSDKMLVLGLMSGTSLDGLDLAFCEFEQAEERFLFKIKSAKTVEYSYLWKKHLAEAKDLKAEAYFELHAAYGRFLAEEINTFIQTSGLKPEAIASHGHTIFHRPESGFSTQLGCGATIAAKTGITTVCDFRSLDTALGGQGAPLVPIGDKYLFGDYEACLNIGGIANISVDDATGNRVAYDVCVANMLLNYLAEKNGQAYDKGGALARSGKLNEDLLNKLNGLSYYLQSGAKSIGREWFEKEIIPIIENSKLTNADLLATSTEHVAIIIAKEIDQLNCKQVLLSGGGAFNTFLIEKLKSSTKAELIIPKESIINFKEALIFAFLGFLRLSNQNNTLRSVTGAAHNSCGGAVYLAG